ADDSASPVDIVAERTYRVTNLDPGIHTIRVHALDEAGNASSPSVISASTLDDVAPSTPANLRVTGRSADTISLAWDASFDNYAVKEYHVYMNGEEEPVLSTDQTSAEITGLQSGTMYSFR